MKGQINTHGKLLDIFAPRDNYFVRLIGQSARTGSPVGKAAFLTLRGQVEAFKRALHERQRLNEFLMQFECLDPSFCEFERYFNEEDGALNRDTIYSHTVAVAETMEVLREIAREIDAQS